MAGKNFKKLRGLVDNYVGSVDGDISNISNKISNFKNNFGTGKNISNFFDQRLADGLDTLIQGSLGVRASNIPEISDKIALARQESRFARNAAMSKLVTGEEKPSTHKLFRYPEMYTNEDGTKDIFPNYIHFRSLERRHKPGRTKTKDGKFIDGTASMSDADTELYDIFLSLPDNLQDNLQVSYSEAEAGMLDQLIGSFFNTNEDVMNNSVFDKEQIKQALLKFLPGNDLREFGQGKMNNPMKFNKFAGVPFRTFTYQFTLRPKNPQESEVLRQMIGVFKRSMLPGVEGTNSRIWTFPNEWAIEFDGLIKNWVDFPLTSVCTSCDVDYTAGAGYVPTIDGAPQAFTMSLGFTETTPLHRQRFFEEVSAANPNRKSKAAQGSELTDNVIKELEKAEAEAEAEIEQTGSVGEPISVEEAYANKQMQLNNAIKKELGL